MSLRLAFAGTPPFAATALAAIVDAGFAVKLVLTQPDRPRGRGLKVAASAVKTLASTRGLPVWQPDSLKSDAIVFPAEPIDVLVVAAYGLILPRKVLDWPVLGCINIHASLLPRWRGAAPIQRALLAGDTESGISIMQMDEGLDTGPVMAQRVVAIGARDTTGTLTNALAEAGEELIVETLRRLDSGQAMEATPQSASGVTYAAKMGRDDATIDWTRDARTIDRQVRACNPAPGALAPLAGESVKVWAADVVDGRFGAPGAIARAGMDGVLVACGDGALLLRELQRPGGKRIGAAAFVAGRPPGGVVPSARLN